MMNNKNALKVVKTLEELRAQNKGANRPLRPMGRRLTEEEESKLGWSTFSKVMAELDRQHTDGKNLS